MGNSPSKNEPLPTSSSSEQSASGSSSNSGDLEPDESAPALSQFKSQYKNNRTESSAIKIGTRNVRGFNANYYNNEKERKESTSPKKHKKSFSLHDLDLDLEIGASMAKLLSVNTVQDYSSSFESERSQSSISPIFTSLGEGRDLDLILSCSMSNSPGNFSTLNSLKGNSKESLDIIAEGSIESTPEPKTRKPRGDQSTKSQAQASNNSIPSSSPKISTTKHGEVDIDSLIDRLLQIGLQKHSPPHVSKRQKDKLPITGEEIKYVLYKARSIFLDQPTLLRLSPPVKVIGDIHGQYYDLIRIFNSCGYPPYSNYLFLGDYVDRGYKSLETILLLFCYKIKYPENFFMLRGNHESANITKIYGFYDECKRRLPSISGNHKLWKSFVDVFNTLPIAATINDKIFCIHGGLSPELQDLKQIENIKRPSDIPDKGLLADLLWSDPDPSIKNFSISNWPKNDRGVSYCFGKRHVDYFCSTFKMDLIVRGHMVVEDGYEFFNKRKLVTIFLAPNYCGEFNNYGAVMNVDKALCCSFELIKPQFKIEN